MEDVFDFAAAREKGQLLRDVASNEEFAARQNTRLVWVLE
jgi:hypothetical protein